ncbi:MAG: 7-carboxy-7-deazaguanine synthase QueE [Verrucomicrobiales bacterium]
MRISEIFYSLQGEGSLAGMPSAFIRTSGCNLRCRWCDTKYASWQPEGDDHSPEQIAAEVRRLAPAARHVVLTGGEPMVAKGIADLAALLREDGFHLTIETAATVPPDGIACDLASLSPKLANSTPLAGEIGDAWIARHEATRLQPSVIREWVDAYPHQLKFVVAGDGDLAEIDALLAEVGGVAPAHVMLMPEGTDAAAIRSREPWLIGLCKARGFRYCPRLHLDWFGNTRGT